MGASSSGVTWRVASSLLCFEEGHRLHAPYRWRNGKTSADLPVGRAWTHVSLGDKRQDTRVRHEHKHHVPEARRLWEWRLDMAVVGEGGGRNREQNGDRERGYATADAGRHLSHKPSLCWRFCQRTGGRPQRRRVRTARRVLTVSGRRQEEEVRLARGTPQESPNDAHVLRGERARCRRFLEVRHRGKSPLEHPGVCEDAEEPTCEIDDLRGVAHREQAVHDVETNERGLGYLAAPLELRGNVAEAPDSLVALAAVQEHFRDAPLGAEAFTRRAVRAEKHERAVEEQAGFREVAAVDLAVPQRVRSARNPAVVLQILAIVNELAEERSRVVQIPRLNHDDGTQVERLHAAIVVAKMCERMLRAFGDDRRFLEPLLLVQSTRANEGHTCQTKGRRGEAVVRALGVIECLVRGTAIAERALCVRPLFPRLAAEFIDGLCGIQVVYE